MSSELVHFIRAESYPTAFDTLIKIIRERRLLGGNSYIRGGYRCVCFCEAPVHIVAEAMRARAVEGILYKPFGIVLPKKYVFSLGGRPVIYQRDIEYLSLPEELRWRHVRYEPDLDHPIDFTWEREWRIKSDEIYLDPAIARIVVPSESYHDELEHNHDRAQDFEVLMLSQVLDEIIAEQYREDFPWDVQRVG
jgi:hypothetical protein